MSKKRRLLLGLYLTSLCLYAQEPIEEIDSLQIIQVLFDQQKAWNSTNINAFMEGYWQSDRLVFSGSGGPIYGWEATKKRYEKNYPDAAAMGTLRFTLLDMIQVDENTVQMQGRYDLIRTLGDNHGYFTLLWKKINKRWLIISDHTSAAN